MHYSNVNDKELKWSISIIFLSMWTCEVTFSQM